MNKNPRGKALVDGLKFLEKNNYIYRFRTEKRRVDFGVKYYTVWLITLQSGELLEFTTMQAEDYAKVECAKYGMNFIPNRMDSADYRDRQARKLTNKYLASEGKYKYTNLDLE